MVATFYRLVVRAGSSDVYLGKLDLLMFDGNFRDNLTIIVL